MRPCNHAHLPPHPCSRRAKLLRHPPVDEGFQLKRECVVAKISAGGHGGIKFLTHEGAPERLEEIRRTYPLESPAADHLPMGRARDHLHPPVYEVVEVTRAEELHVAELDAGRVGGD